MWPHRTPGIPDELFERDEGVPITKEEIRAVQISKARLSQGCTVHDVGCGSGSVTVEACLQAGPSGNVYAIDRDPKATELTRKNLARFGQSAKVIESEATEALPSLPEADATLIGGTGGQTAEIMRLCRSRLKKGGRIVVGIIQVETLCSALEALYEPGFKDAEAIQVAVSKSRKTSTGTMMLARNPVAVLSATRDF